MRTTSRRTDERGQTTLDFAIAMGLFLLAVAFTFSFVPSMTAPFVETHQDGSVASDRIASHLSEGALGDPNEPFVVNESCATHFFDDDPSQPPSHCGYSGDGYKERVGVSDRIDVRVEVLHVNTTATNADRFRTVCTNGSVVIHKEQGSCTIKYEVGGEPSPDDSVTVARRVVTFPGCDFGTESCDATLKVEVW